MYKEYDMAKGSRGGKRTKTYNGVPLVNDPAEVINVSPNHIGNEKQYDFILTDPNTGRNLRPFSRKKGDLASVLSKYPVDSFYMSTYTDKSADNAVRALSAIGYKPVKAFIGGQLTQGVNRLYYLFEKQ